MAKLLVQAKLHRMPLYHGVLMVVVLLLLAMGRLHAHADALRDVANQHTTKDDFVQALEHEFLSDSTWNRAIQLNRIDVSIQAPRLEQQINLSDYIWSGAVDLLPKAWNTTFIAGVANGNMNPNFYADYILQDAVYCRIVAQLWTQLANNASVDEKVRNYANGSIDGFGKKCADYLFATFNIQDDGGDNYGVIVKEPVIEYTTFIENTMLAYPPNTLIATYACLKLWNNLIQDLLAIVQNSTIYNPYSVWVIENNGSGSSLRRQAAQMDEWDKQYKWYDWSEALSLFRTAILNEINFFDQAGGGWGNGEREIKNAGLYTMQH